MIALLFALATAVAGEIPLTPSDVTAQTDPAVAADTTQAVVVWIEANQVRLARVGFDGALPDGAGLIVSPSSRSLPRCPPSSWSPGAAAAKARRPSTSRGW